MKKKALITGFTGMVGSHLADYILENSDWDIFGLVRWQDDYSNVNHLIDRINNKNRVYLVYGDLLDHISLENAIKKCSPDFTFHLAAQSYPLTSFESPVNTLDTNIIGTERLLDVLKTNYPKCIIHICSSSEVFGKVPSHKLPIGEDCGFHPASPYAISKVGTDLIGRYYAEAYKMTVMTTRMFTHTGPRRGDVFAESTFAKQIAMIENNLQEPIIYVGNLKSLRTWSDVRDAVRAYFMLVTINPTPGEYYNIGGNYTCTVEEMLKYLISLSKVENIQIKTDKTRLRPIDADAQIPDTRKFKRHTGWEPSIPFEKTMKDLLNYWREQISKYGQKINR